MIADIDIWRTADVVVRQPGEEAQLFAMRRISELTIQGDKEGA